jgi:hypothetical protein
MNQNKFYHFICSVFESKKNKKVINRISIVTDLLKIFHYYKKVVKSQKDPYYSLFYG